MCGRAYITYTPEELYFNYLNKQTWRWNFINSDLDFDPNYNVCPTQNLPVLIVKSDQLQFKTMRWGLVPSWAESVKAADKYSMINARLEDIDFKRSYKEAFQRRRCVVSISGFYEWLTSTGQKQAYSISLVDSAIMSIAGIYEDWISPLNNEVISSFSILTMAANQQMGDIHKRMPVILAQESWEDWLEPGLSQISEIHKLLDDNYNASLKIYEVSSLVNSIRNNTSENLLPLDRRVTDT